MLAAAGFLAGFAAWGAYPPGAPGPAYAAQPADGATTGAAPSVVGARLGLHPDKTRFVLEVSDRVAFRAVVRDAPYRIVVELPDLAWTGADAPRPGMGIIRSYHAERPQPGTLRLVLETAGPARIGSAMLMEPSEGHQSRLVLDIAPSTPEAVQHDKDEVRSGRAQPPQAAPNQTASPQAAPNQTASPQTAPNQTASPQAAPRQTASPQNPPPPAHTAPPQVAAAPPPPAPLPAFRPAPAPAPAPVLSAAPQSAPQSGAVTAAPGPAPGPVGAPVSLRAGPPPPARTASPAAATAAPVSLKPSVMAGSSPPMTPTPAVLVTRAAPRPDPAPMAEGSTPAPAPSQPQAQFAAVGAPPPPAPASKPRRAPPPGKPMIALDPGHGGVDPGATGINGIHEKDITLATARELRRQLEATGRYRVMLTRDEDEFVPLRERVARARQAGADLFMSLHADSIARADVRGLSIYTQSDKSSDHEADTLAAKENRADAIGGIDLSHENDQVATILIDLAQRDTRNHSRRFATLALREAAHVIRLLPQPDRSAAFAVLTAPDVPSVLIEMGYLSSMEDAALLTQPQHRQHLSAALVHAIDGYFSWLSGGRHS